jgi:hypothetical protein
MSIVSKPNVPPSPNPDSEDQRRLRVIAEELATLMDKHDVGGVVMLESRESSAWRFVIPKWAGLQLERGGIRVRINSKTPEAQAIGNATVGMLASLRDVSHDIGEVFGNLFKQVKAALEAQGSGVDHNPFGGKGGVGPSGKLRS